MRDDESVEVSSLPSSCSITLGAGAESNPTTGDLELSEEAAPSSSSSSPSPSSSDKTKSKKKKKLVVLGFLLIAALVAAAISVGVRSSSNSSANKSTTTAAALGEFATYDASSSSSSKSGKSGDSKSSYSRSGTSSTKSPTEGPTADPTSSPSSTFCPNGYSSKDEGEECRTSRPDDFNGGCGAGDSGFTNITFCESVFGTVSDLPGNFGNASDAGDTDWYKFEVSTDTTVSVRLTTDFLAFLILYQLGDGDPCGDITRVAETEIAVGDTYIISSNVTAGDYSILVAPQRFDDSSLFCPSPGNYTLELFEGPIP